MSVSFSEANCWKNVALSSNGGVASCRKHHNCHRVIRNLLSLICQTQGYFVTNISKLKWLMLKFQMKARVKCWTIIFRNLSEAASKCSYFISLLDNRWILESVFGSISRVQFTQSGFLSQNSIRQILPFNLSANIAGTSEVSRRNKTSKCNYFWWKLPAGDVLELSKYLTQVLI